MNLIKFAEPERGFWTHCIEFTYDDINNAAATADTIALFSAPAGSVVANVCLIVKTAFAGTSISALTAEVGDGGDTDRLLGATNLLVINTAGIGTGARDNWAYTAADTVDITLAATGANLTALTVGVGRILFRLDQINDHINV